LVLLPCRTAITDLPSNIAVSPSVVLLVPIMC
jgi:hypothetical protein